MKWNLKGELSSRRFAEGLERKMKTWISQGGLIHSPQAVSAAISGANKKSKQATSTYGSGSGHSM